MRRQHDGPGTGDGGSPIAIVGIGCRFPGGADSPEAFWRLLADGRDAVGPMPERNLGIEGHFHPEPGHPDSIVTLEGGFLPDLDLFEPGFFGISPREAQVLDPQQRLLLELTWHAFEDAGIVPAAVAGRRVGVYVGMWTNEYEDYLYGVDRDIDLYATTGGGRHSASGRLCYAFDFRGPSVTLDTACSSSLAAIHLACQSLREGETELAVAAGVNLILQPHISIGYSRSRMLSPRGRCRFGDASADGYVRSEGAAVLLLKPLADALAHGDRIHALVRGSAVNNDGRGSGLLVAPSVDGQRAMLVDAYRAAGVAPADVQYVEAHGTGTRVGDPVEIEALAAVLGAGRRPGETCLVGSVKTNIGHTEAASGMAGVVKVALAMRHGVVPASLHVNELNPAIRWDRLCLAQAATPWPAVDGSRIAGVNSFGITGTNAHVVLQQAAPAITRDAAPAIAPFVLAVSGHADAARTAIAHAYAACLRDVDAAELADICYTAARRRTHHEYRGAVVGRTASELVEGLDALARGDDWSGVVAGHARREAAHRVAFVFPGQGAQWTGMARGLLRSEPVFAAALRECDAAVAQIAGWSVIDVLEVDDDPRLSSIDVIQPVLFSIQVAFAALWRAWGVEPSVVVGHSMGEVAAAHVAGALSLDDAALVICRRSALMHTTSGQGAMAVVELSLDDAASSVATYEGRLSIAVSNSARSTVVAGDPAALDDLLTALEARDVFTRRIKVDVASHSPQMDPLVPELVARVAAVSPADGALAFFSTARGTLLAGRELSASYWGENLRQPVLFGTATAQLIAAGYDTFIEMSPHPLLVSAIQETASATGVDGVLAVTSGRRDEDECVVMRTSAATLHCHGRAIDWAALTPSGRVVSLPLLPWQRERFWFDAPADGEGRPYSGAGPRGTHPLLRSAIDVAARPGTRIWPCRMDSTGPAWLLDHHVRGSSVVSHAVLLELMLAVARDVFGTRSLALHDVALQAPLPLDLEARPVIQVAGTLIAGRRLRLEVHHIRDGRAQALATADAATTDLKPASRPAVRPRDAHGLDGEAFHALLASCGLTTGPALQCVVGVDREAGSTSAIVEVSADGVAFLQDYVVDPRVLHAALQIATLTAADAAPLFLPVRIDEVVHAGGPREGVRVVGERVSTSGVDVVEHVRVFDERGDTLLELRGLVLRAAPDAAASTPVNVNDWFYDVAWEPAPVAAPSTIRTQAKADRWLIVGDGDGLGDALARWLSARGQRVSRVVDRAVEAPAAAGAGHLDGLADLDGVIWLSGLDAPAPSTAADLQAVTTQGAWQLTSAVQAALKTGRPASPRFWIVTRGAQPIGGAVVAPWQAPLWGVAKALLEEHPEASGAIIDVDPGADADAAAIAIGTTLSARDREDGVAWRAGLRYVPRLRRVTSVSAMSGAAGTDDGTYVVTGGFGGVGRLVARWLVTRGARRLVLVGRTAIPPRHEWLTVPADSSAGERIAFVRSLEDAGASVQVAALDLGDEGALRDWFDRFNAGMHPPVRGVLHCAATIRKALLLTSTRDDFSQAFAAKCAGAFALDRVLADAPLDFFVSFSSITAVVPQAGQASYSAANVFLDSFASWQRSHARPALSIGWGVWRGVGMVGRLRQEADQIESTGLRGFDPGDGLEALDKALQLDCAHVVAVPADWNAVAAARGASVPPLVDALVASASPTPAASASSPFRAVLDDAPAHERQGRIERHLQELAARVLRMAVDRLDPQTPLGSFGLESLMAMELRGRMEASLRTRIPVTFIWNYPTVRGMAQHLATHLYEGSPVASREGADAVAVPPAPAAPAEAVTDEDALRQLMGGDS